MAGRTRPDRLSPERTAKHLSRIAKLLEEVGPAWFDAADMGVRPFRRAENARGRSFEDTDPTASTALSQNHRAIRSRARRAAGSIERAMECLEEAASFLADARLATDPDEWVRATQKRQAALA